MNFVQKKEGQQYFCQLSCSIKKKKYFMKDKGGFDGKPEKKQLGNPLADTAYRED
ncbi:MAG: hypothetical protein HFG52_14085 [Lachnospiraceae bacterium]|nr:hypothetical protein [Lachnospiraceae bacterium]